MIETAMAPPVNQEHMRTLHSRAGLHNALTPCAE